MEVEIARRLGNKVYSIVDFTYQTTGIPLKLLIVKKNTLSSFYVQKREKFIEYIVHAS